MSTESKKKYVKLEEGGKIQLPIDFDDPQIPKEIKKFLETHTPVLNFKFPKTARRRW